MWSGEIMERLSHDLNLALEESNCSKQGRRKFGLRRRTRSTGNIPSSCVTGITEDGSSSSPPQPPIIAQVLSDSDDPQLNQLQQTVSSKTRAAQFCHIGNIESDSFNENFSPSKPPNARRKRKFKKMAIDYSDNSNGKTSPSLLIGPSQLNLVSNCTVLNVSGTSPLTLINKKKRIFKHTCQDAYRANIFCGKRKWSHRERNEIGEMRERSFSGGCSSKSYFFSKGNPKSYHDLKNNKKFLPLDKVPKFKDKHVVPAKCAAVKNGIESALQSINLSNLSSDKPSLPGSSTFNFVYRNKNNLPSSETSKSLGIKIATELPPFFSNLENNNNPSSSHKQKHKSRNGKHKTHYKSNNSDQLRNPLQFDDGSGGMDFAMANDFLSSSSLSSSDSEGVVTNDSDREGDDELTDWPGNEEISSFNRSLNLKVQRPFTSAASKVNLKKDKYIPKLGLSSCKNKTDTVKTDVNQDSNDVQLMDDDTLMSDSGSVLDTFAMTRSQSDPLGPSLLPQNSFTSFSDVKNAGLLNNNANEAFFQSFQTFQDKIINPNASDRCFVPRSNFTLQKTSSSDLNLSEKSPQSDHCYSENSPCFGTSEIREIRAGCRRIRDERPGFTILSAANEQLSKFLRDPCQDELKLQCFTNDPEEKEKLSSLAKLYSLELHVEMGRPILRKTINTTQSVMMDQTRFNRQKFLSDFKRRCYGNNCENEQMEPHSHQHPSTSDPCHSSSGVAPDICLPTLGNPLPNFGQNHYANLTKSPTVNDLSVSQDLDQGFSEPNPLEGCSLDMESRNGMDVRPDILSHVPMNQNLTDSSSFDLAELD